MLERLYVLIVDESLWLPLSMSLALAVTALRFHRRRRPDTASGRPVLPAMNLFVGATLATMACGHLAAVTAKLAVGRLAGPVFWLYVIGAILVVPSLGLAADSWRRLGDDGGPAPTALILNAWLAVALLALGRVNLPLAVPPVLAICYQLVLPRRALGWAVVGLMIAVQVGLFVGSLIFMASGLSFDEFRATW